MRVKTFIKIAKNIISSEGDVPQDIKIEFQSFTIEEQAYIKGELYSYKEMLEKSDLEKRKNEPVTVHSVWHNTLSDSEFYSMLK